MTFNLEEEFQLCLSAMYKHIDNRVLSGLLTEEESQQLYHEIDHRLEQVVAQDQANFMKQMIEFVKTMTPPIVPNYDTQEAWRYHLEPITGEETHYERYYDNEKFRYYNNQDYDISGWRKKY